VREYSKILRNKCATKFHSPCFPKEREVVRLLFPVVARTLQEVVPKFTVIVKDFNLIPCNN